MHCVFPQVDLLLDEKKLRDEIKYLERKAQLMNIGKGLYQTCPSKTDEDENFADQIYNQSKKLSLLLKWCRLVGRIYGVNVRDESDFFPLVDRIHL